MRGPGGGAMRETAYAAGRLRGQYCARRAMTTTDLPTLPGPARPRRLRRALLWGALVALLLVAQTLLVALTIKFESSRAQDEADGVAAEAAAEVRHDLFGMVQTLQALGWNDADDSARGIFGSERHVLERFGRNFAAVVDIEVAGRVAHQQFSGGEAGIGVFGGLACHRDGAFDGLLQRLDREVRTRHAGRALGPGR